MLRKLFSAASLLSALVAAPLLTGCNDGPQKKRIIILTNGNSPFWDACRVGMQQAAKDLDIESDDYMAVMEVNDGTPDGQIKRLRDFASQDDVVAVAVSAVDADNVAVADEMRNLRKKGVKVICVDADLNREKLADARKYYIGTDNIQGGRALGSAARHLLKYRNVEKGNYVHFVGRTGSHNARERMAGFNENVGKNFKEVDRMGDNIKTSKARENVRNALVNHENLVALVGIWSYNAPAIVDVLVQKEQVGDYVVLCFDAEPAAINQMDKGQIDVMVVQDPYRMGYESVRVLKAMCEEDDESLKKTFTDKEQPAILTTGLKVVVPNEKSPLKSEMFDEKSVTFMKLDEFKTWLEKYNLKGS